VKGNGLVRKVSSYGLGVRDSGFRIHWLIRRGGLVMICRDCEQLMTVGQLSTYRHFLFGKRKGQKVPLYGSASRIPLKGFNDPHSGIPACLMRLTWRAGKRTCESSTPSDAQAKQRPGVPRTKVYCSLRSCRFLVRELPPAHMKHYGGQERTIESANPLADDFGS
jgi:hypothetical protein